MVVIIRRGGKGEVTVRLWLYGEMDRWLDSWLEEEREEVEVNGEV